MENKNKILLAYQKLKNYYEDNTNEISREEIFSLIRNIYISHYIFVDNNSHQVAAEKSNELISKQIENTIQREKNIGQNKRQPFIFQNHCLFLCPF